MTRSVDEVELVALAVASTVGHAYRLELDRDPALPLQVHAVEHLVLHVALADRAGELEQPVGQRRFPVVDVGDDAKVAHAGLAGCGHEQMLVGFVTGPEVSTCERGSRPRSFDFCGWNYSSAQRRRVSRSCHEAGDLSVVGRAGAGIRSNTPWLQHLCGADPGHWDIRGRPGTRQLERPDWHQ